MGLMGPGNPNIMGTVLKYVYFKSPMKMDWVVGPPSVQLDPAVQNSSCLLRVRIGL